MLTVTMFRERLGERFQIWPDAQTAIETELMEVKSLSDRVRMPGGREPFSLIFRGPLTPGLSQRSYRVVNETMGTLEVFLVPVGPGYDGMQYEAVFN